MGIYSTVQAPWNDAGAEFDYNRPVFGWFLMPVLQKPWERAKSKPAFAVSDSVQEENRIKIYSCVHFGRNMASAESSRRSSQEDSSKEATWPSCSGR